MRFHVSKLDAIAAACAAPVKTSQMTRMGINNRAHNRRMALTTNQLVMQGGGTVSYPRTQEGRQAMILYLIDPEGKSNKVGRN